ncbi:hypothetical protein [Pseudomonas sp. NPDC087639]|uniref:hypothetical protein n=1 Tax=Pseudomonas sp. NPDC087639 TaxID=3364445 RepID=UPI003801F637
MATFEEEGTTGPSGDAQTLDSPPYILTPFDGGKVGALVTVTGGGHARRHVRIVTPGKEDYLSYEKQMDGDGSFSLPLINGLKPGKSEFQVLQWESRPESHMRSKVWTVYNITAPLISSKHNNQLVGNSFLLTGTGCPPYAKVVSEHSSTHEVIGEGNADGNGNFSIMVATPRQSPSLSLFVFWSDSVNSRASDIITVRVLAPLLLGPANELLVGKKTTFWGDGLSGSTVDLYRYNGAIEHYGSAPVLNGKWTITSNDLPEGRIQMHVRGMLENLAAWSSVVVLNVIHAPVISSPGSGSLVDSTFTIEGSKGMPGATVEILRDTGEHNPIATGPVPEGTESWRVTVSNMPPGPLSLVAEQFVSGLAEHSRRSLPRGFKVRPAKFTGVTVELTDTSIKFSGSAHLGATVVITVPGSTVTPPAPVVANGGNWTTTATGWPYGIYTAHIIQKVGDGASGWIESLPFEFTVENRLPDVSELAFTPEYQPTFSGKGNARATVWLWKIDKDEAVAPHVPLTVSGKWSSKASEIWGPTYNRRVRIKQAGDGQETEWVYLDVTIPPLAPGLNDPVEDGLSPKLSGTCWPGAAVKIRYSDEDQVEHDGIVSGGTWQFRRDKEFAPDVSHTVTVTQFAAEQTSPPVSKTFTVKILMLQPLITQPEDGAKVGRVVTIQGKNGMEGATMQLRDVRFDRPLGSPKVLDKDGDWSIDLSALEFRLYTFDAQQTLLGRPSARSDARTFEVVLLPPEFLQPTQNGKLPRMAKLEGRGMANGYVEIFLEGLTEPLLTDVPVNREGHWEAEVTLPVGHKTIWARQTFMDETGKLQESEDTPLLQFDLVPAAPFVESPVENDQVGQQVVVSGFGVPGDTVTVQLNLGTQSTVVLEDRTWSVKVTSGVRSGFHVLQATAMYNNFESDPAQRTLEQSTYRPVIDEPAAGRWLSDPVTLAGKGRAGSVHVVSWFNPDVKWSPPLAVSGDAWRGESEVPLPPGGNWCRVGQTLVDDPTGVEASDWALSARFEIKNSKPT